MSPTATKGTIKEYGETLYLPFHMELTKPCTRCGLPLQSAQFASDATPLDVYVRSFTVIVSVNAPLSTMILCQEAITLAKERVDGFDTNQYICMNMPSHRVRSKQAGIGPQRYRNTIRRLSKSAVNSTIADRPQDSTWSTI